MFKKAIDKINDTTTNTYLRLVRETEGLSTVEYVIILVLIAVGGIALWTHFGETLTARIIEADGQIGDMNLSQ